MEYKEQFKLADYFNEMSEDMSFQKLVELAIKGSADTCFWNGYWEEVSSLQKISLLVDANKVIAEMLERVRDSAARGE